MKFFDTILLNDASHFTKGGKPIDFNVDKNDEIIISDDGSSDNTIKIIESYKDGRIVLYKNNHRRLSVGYIVPQDCSFH